MSEYLKGLRTVIDNLQDAVERIGHGSSRGLTDAVLFIGSESQQRVPVKTGDLRGSLEVEVNGVTIAKGIKSGGIAIKASPPEKATIGQVSYNTPYAATQHERLDFKHVNGQAKYLESVVDGEQKRILRLIAGEIINELEE